MEPRAEAFNKLKPACIAVSQVALQLKTNNSGVKQLVNALSSLLEVLQGVNNLDEKLADYVFFPLSYVFRDSATLPASAVDTALGCLRILIERGWRQRMSTDLCKQLLILLGYFAGRDSSVKDTNEVTFVATLQCMISLFEYARPAVSAFGDVDETESLPVIGHIVTLILAALTESGSVDIQEKAVKALHGLIFGLSNDQMLRNFLPGIISKMTKVLQQNTRSRRPHRVLAQSLDTVSLLLKKTMTNTLSSISSIGSRDQPKIDSSANNMDQGWLKATTGQVKLALANITSLRNHERAEVLEALLRLCMVVLKDCNETLADASALMLETSVCVCSNFGEDIVASTQLKNLQELLTVRKELQDMLGTSLFDWINALPRVLLSTDDLKHRTQIGYIGTAYKILSYMDDNSSMMDTALASSLQDSTAAVMELSSRINIQVMRDKPSDFSLTFDIATIASDNFHFNPLSIARSQQSATLQEILGLIRQLGVKAPRLTLMRQLTNSLPHAIDNDRLACLWLSSKLFFDLSQEATQIQHYLEDTYEASTATREFMEVTYSHCVDILAAPAIEDGSDWRLQAIALEVVAAQSVYDGSGFRPELVDCLYLILERLGSPNTLLRDHAITCLNILSGACRYDDVSALIIENADYLVNAVALRFNTFEISPQAPQVLAMMVKLCGSRLIPFLDDLVESIFSVLASFHGYTRLAESLFRVLQIIAEESSSASPLKLGEPILSRRRPGHSPVSVADVATYLKPKKGQTSNDEDLSLERPSDGKDALGTPLNDSASEDDDQRTSKMESTELTRDQPRPSKTYVMTQSIVRLGQHYLTHESPSLRQGILQLTGTGCVGLAAHEDEYLPLINDIWPVVVKRLYDLEPFVCIAAADTLAKIFQTAGDFVSSRVANEWQDMCQLYREIYSKTVTENRGRGGRGAFTSAHQVWEALVRMFVELSTTVRVDADMEDVMIEMLGPMVESRQDVRDALELLNADAVWLQLQSQQQQCDTAALWKPFVEGFNFKEIRL